MYTENTVQYLANVVMQKYRVAQNSRALFAILFVVDAMHYSEYGCSATNITWVRNADNNPEPRYPIAYDDTALDKSAVCNATLDVLSFIMQNLSAEACYSYSRLLTGHTKNSRLTTANSFDQSVYGRQQEIEALDEDAEQMLINRNFTHSGFNYKEMS